MYRCFLSRRISLVGRSRFASVIATRADERCFAMTSCTLTSPWSRWLRIQISLPLASSGALTGTCLIPVCNGGRLCHFSRQSAL